MVELYPAPFPDLLHRILVEHEREAKIFDLPSNKFYRPDANYDLSVSLHRGAASTPVGPAAGPQSQMAQNILLAWLAGSRIIELKTVQINDQLRIPRPCIDATNVGYNVEWSQELKLPVSLKEYVAGSMLIDIMRHLGLPNATATDTIFDMSVGYDLAGIKSPPVRQWMAQMRDARHLVEELRAEIPAQYAHLREIDFHTTISDSITLSTFHGCPAHEIEKIVEFLIEQEDVHTIIKMNPTLLGREAVEHLLHEVMGYHEVRVTAEAFDKDLQFDQALEICHRLGRLAASKGKKLGVKFSNTLVVLNHKTFFTDKEMYLSGAPLHIITMNLVKKFREAMGHDIPISFSAGIDQHNFPEAVSQGFVPVTTCTDLLRPGGYGRLPSYLNRLQQRMKAVGVNNIPDFIVKAEGNGLAAINGELDQLSTKIAHHEIAQSSFRQPILNWVQELRETCQQWLNNGGSGLKELFDQQITALHQQLAAESLGNYGEAPREVVNHLTGDLHDAIVRRAGGLNTNSIVPRITIDPRYSKKKNEAVPRKIGSHLWLYDCINCDKCIPVCPNDANFSYEIAPFEAQCRIYEISNGEVVSLPGRLLKVAKADQIGNFADFCNECGNCDIFCPEDGGPYLEKPRFFGTLETMRIHEKHDGCTFTHQDRQWRAYGRFSQREYSLTVNDIDGQAIFSDGTLQLHFNSETNICKETKLLQMPDSSYQLDDYYYYLLSSLLKGVMISNRINYLNMARITTGEN